MCKCQGELVCTRVFLTWHTSNETQATWRADTLRVESEGLRRVSFCIWNHTQTHSPSTRAAGAERPLWANKSHCHQYES